MDNETSEQVKVPNPTGKGGFQDHPELRNSGGRPKNQESFAYWINFFKNLKVKKFLEYETKKPDNKRFVAESIAYARVAAARTDLKEFKEIANRTEGMPKQSLDLQGNLNVSNVINKLNKEIDESE